MGKYMRKSKSTKGEEVALMDVSSSSQTSLGVRTRAKTLALQRLQLSSPPPPASSSYIQLRSRRLVKSPSPAPATVLGESKKVVKCVSSPNSKSRAAAAAYNSKSNSNSHGSTSEEVKKLKKLGENEENPDLGIEASFGENVLEFDGRERSTRESTPCSLIRDPDTVRTPGSSTRPTTSADDANRRVRNSMQRHIPTANEMDEFFSVTEEKQQKQFMDKYNFDPVNDKTLPGRFEWVEVDSKKC